MYLYTPHGYALNTLQNQIDNDDDYDDDYISGRKSVTRCTSSIVLACSSKQKSENTPADPLTSGQPVLTLVRQSAFKPRIFHARDVLLQAWKFQKVEYNEDTRGFTVYDGDDSINEIMLSPQWATDLDLGNGHARNSAYLGSGFSKNVFYVSRVISWIETAFLEHQSVGPL